MTRRPPKKKTVAPQKSKPIKYRSLFYGGDSDLKQAARRHQVILTSGRPRSCDGERIEGPWGRIEEGWETFRMYLTEPSKNDDWPLSDAHSYSPETEQRIERASAAGLEQHGSNFFRWPSNYEAKTKVALELIGARHDPNAPVWTEPLQLCDEEEVYIEPEPVRSMRAAYYRQSRNKKRWRNPNVSSLPR